MFQQVQSSQLSHSGLGAQVFGDDSSECAASCSVECESSDTESEQSYSSDNASLVSAMAPIAGYTSPWASTPSYPPLYLSTVQEYLPPPPQSKFSLDSCLQDSKGSKHWELETYENSLNVDNVFERFAKRVGYEGAQCVRYVKSKSCLLNHN
jgi:pre-rRNA-processing protein TSR4